MINYKIMRFFKNVLKLLTLNAYKNIVTDFYFFLFTSYKEVKKPCFKISSFLPRKNILSKQIES